MYEASSCDWLDTSLSKHEHVCTHTAVPTGVISASGLMEQYKCGRAVCYWTVLILPENSRPVFKSKLLLIFSTELIKKNMLKAGFIRHKAFLYTTKQVKLTQISLLPDSAGPEGSLGWSGAGLRSGLSQHGVNLRTFITNSLILITFT